MSEYKITVAGGTSVRLPTAGKYCDRDIIITATGSDAVEPDFHDLYQRVEYIESDGEAHIITDFIADNTCGMEVIASFPELEDKIPMGSRSDTGATRFYCVYPMSANSFYFGFNTGSAISVKPSIDTIYRLQTNFLNSRLVNIFNADGVRQGGTSISVTLAQQEGPVAIFGYYLADTDEVTSLRKYKFYGARCSRGYKVDREYTPCYRKSDGVIGVLEELTGRFETNAGSGALTSGPEIDW